MSSEFARKQRFKLKKITRLLHDLVKNWCQQYWTQIKKIRMKVDISDYAMGGVLYIEYKDRKQIPIVYLLKEIEKIYEIYNKEMLVVIKELEN